MSQDANKRSALTQIFMTMMILCGLTWVWTVAFILAWPWDKTSTWKPEHRLAAVCAESKACGVAHGELEAARAAGRVASLLPADDAGEVMEEENWLRWKKVTGQPWQIEATASSWHFETSLRYRLEGDTPVLVEAREIGAKTIYFGVGAALLSLALIFLRKLRR